MTAGAEVAFAAPAALRRGDHAGRHVAGIHDREAAGDNAGQLAADEIEHELAACRGTDITRTKHETRQHERRVQVGMTLEKSAYAAVRQDLAAEIVVGVGLLACHRLVDQWPGGPSSTPPDEVWTTRKTPASYAAASSASVPTTLTRCSMSQCRPPPL